VAAVYNSGCLSACLRMVLLEKGVRIEVLSQHRDAKENQHHRKFKKADFKSGSIDLRIRGNCRGYDRAEMESQAAADEKPGQGRSYSAGYITLNAG